MSRTIPPDLAHAKAVCLERLLRIVRESECEVQARLAAAVILRYRPEPEEVSDDQPDAQDKQTPRPAPVDHQPDHKPSSPRAPGPKPLPPPLTSEELSRLRRALPDIPYRLFLQPQMANYWRNYIPRPTPKPQPSPTAASPPDAAAA
ncbi:MAG: hypothetical protein ACK4WH_04515 [Phycisphaerales bacterium]